MIWFKTFLPPLGVHTQLFHRLIIVNETVFYLKKCYSNDGRGHRNCRVRCPAHYKINEAKLNVILVVEIENANISAHLDGNIAQPRKWMRLTVENVD